MSIGLCGHDHSSLHVCACLIGLLLSNAGHQATAACRCSARSFVKPLLSVGMARGRSAPPHALPGSVRHEALPAVVPHARLRPPTLLPPECGRRAVEETIRRHNHFAIGEVRKLWHDSPRLWKLLKSSQGLLRPLPEARCRRWVLPSDIGESGEKLGTPCGREADAHRVSSLRNGVKIVSRFKSALTSRNESGGYFGAIP